MTKRIRLRRIRVRRGWVPGPGTRASGEEFVTLGRLRLGRPVASQGDPRPPCQRNARQRKGEANPTGCVWDRPVQGARPSGSQGINDQLSHKGEKPTKRTTNVALPWRSMPCRSGVKRPPEWRTCTMHGTRRRTLDPALPLAGCLQFDSVEDVGVADDSDNLLPVKNRGPADGGMVQEPRTVL